MSKRLEKAGANIAESIGRGPAGQGGSARPMSAGGGRARDQGNSLSKDVRDIDLDRIIPDPDQPRGDFDPESIERMAGSLKKRGQLQPISVRWSEPAEKWVIISGERRWRGAVQAGLKSLKAIVREVEADSEELFADQVVENAVREDLSSIEQAKAYRRLMDRNGWNGQQLAEELNISEARVSQVLALNELAPEVQEMVKLEEISSSTGTLIAQIPDGEKQAEVARTIAEKKLNRDQARAEVAKAKPRKKGRAPKVSKDWRHKQPVRSGYKLVLACPRGIDYEGALAFLEEALDTFRSQRPVAASA